mmetsp:Transcript_48523/g.89082  ORF Transcript_48523/g.89082 Transcript_48523/m.89082 type:complete len:621 (-) Transcript_48523:31-1893(-)
MSLTLQRVAFLLAGVLCDCYAWRSKPSAEHLREDWLTQSQRSMRAVETPADAEQLIGRVRSQGSLHSLRTLSLLFLASEAAAAFRLAPPGRQHCLGCRARAVRMAAQQRRRSDFKKEDLDWDRKNRGPEHPLTLSSLVSYAAALTEEGQKDKAEPFMKEAVNLTRRVLGPEDPETLRAVKLYEDTFGQAKTADGAFFAELPEEEPSLQNSTLQSAVEATSDVAAASEGKQPEAESSLQNGSRGATAEAASDVATPSEKELPQKEKVQNDTIQASKASDEDPSMWPIDRLLDWLDDRLVDREDCTKKEHLVERVRETLAKIQEKEKAAQEKASPKATQAKEKTTPSPPRRDAREFKEFGELVYTDATIPSDQGPCSVIFLHGFGDSARGLASNVPRLLQLPEMRFVLPTAKITAGGVFSMTSWFDADAMVSSGGMNVANWVMQDSIDYVHHLIRVEMDRGVPSDRIFVGGFSQGGCAAVRAALSFPDGPLGGCFALSCFLGDSFPPIADANKKLRVLNCHGQADPIVPPSEGSRLCMVLEGRGIKVTGLTYPNMGHASSPEEAQDVRRFLKQRLVAQGGPEILEKLTESELKPLLEEMGINVKDCADQSEMRERAKYWLFD